MWNQEFDINYSTDELDFIAWLLAHGFEDTSWHNDACPSFERDNLRIYLDYPKDQSDMGDAEWWTKYAAFHQIEYSEQDETKPAINTNSLVQLMNFLTDNLKEE